MPKLNEALARHRRDHETLTPYHDALGSSNGFLEAQEYATDIFGGKRGPVSSRPYLDRQVSWW